MQGRSKSWNRLVFPAFAAMLALSCDYGKKMHVGASEWFAKTYSCPDNRVTVKARPELKYGDLLVSITASSEPPAEVKKDPERLAKWTSDQKQDADKTAHNLNHLEVFETTGCEHRNLIGCDHGTYNDNEGTHTDWNVVNCWQLPEKVEQRYLK